MSLTDSITERLSAIVAGKLDDAAHQRMAALFSVRGLMPEADVFDRVRLARYILTGREDEPEREMVEVKTMSGETIAAYPEQPDYPHTAGGVEVLGPGIFANTDAPAGDTVINWQGVNFVRQPDPDAEIAPGLPTLTAEPAPTSGEGWAGHRG